ncbi:sodium-coupled monocarboxylate transporter 2-like [Phlebotomus papatasi]|uniref:sodium-coupled monocarboxylate transporter 2-like n=1 Tax=Phlebotomus papatasi TaxID=29031 RepID=UPI002483F06C|nr:sodium-coupled monocarboxylate transporter 2-like [Phlebotomus papatasi]
MYSISLLFVPFVLPTVFLPIFNELKLTSSFKYFELRFNRRVRLLASGIFLLTGLLVLPVTVYVPALTFQRVTGLNTYITVTVLSLLCASYTAVGGFKAVIWTDVVQLALIIASYIIVTVIGIQEIGGIQNVIEAGNRGGRIIFLNLENFNTRSSFPGYVFSISLMSIYQYGLNQTNLQRFLSLSNIRKMTISTCILIFIFVMIILGCMLLGIVIYANYETCDPLKAGIIRKVDQIFPHFVQDKASLFLGFNGIFIAGIFSASLSTTSSYFNAMSGIIYEDFISHRFPGNLQSTASKFMKFTVIILAFVQIILVFFIEKMGMIAQMTIQIYSMNAGALLTLFTLGAVVPKANSVGAQVGAITAILSVLTLMIGSIGRIAEPNLPFRTDGCNNNLTAFNSTIVNYSTQLNDSEEIFWLFRVSYMYYALIGVFLGITSGYIASILTGGNTIEDQRLLAPFLRRKPYAEEEEKVKLKTESCNE